MSKFTAKLFRYLFFILPLSCIAMNISAQSNNNRVRIGIDGLTHSHVHGVLQTLSQPDSPIEIVGIAESNPQVVAYYAKRYGFDEKIVFKNVEEMIEKTKPEGVVAFNSIFEHLKTVEACAPKGIHVMVEKPLAVNMEHAAKMEKLARQNNTLLLTNYETTWYPSNQKVYEMINTRKAFGEIRKVIICDGHQGPKEIRVEPEFLEWLTDPILNGGGAVVDFGCYGANLMTWLMKNECPETVSATLQQIKPDIYPKVDDEATIILAYPKAQAIVQGSWNWPIGRKDMEVYATGGYIKAPNAQNINYRFVNQKKEVADQLPPLNTPYNDPFKYFAAAIKGTIQVSEYDLSSLENNLLVVKILDAARESARTGQVIKLK